MLGPWYFGASFSGVELSGFRAFCAGHWVHVKVPGDVQDVAHIVSYVQQGDFCSNCFINRMHSYQL